MTRRNIRAVTKPPITRILTRDAATGQFASRLHADGTVLEVVRPGEAAPADYVLLPREEYERLLDEEEDREAVAAYDRTRGQETVPSELAERLVGGENPVRVWREHRGMTLDQLAAAIGKHKGFLSEIESGKKTGSVDTLKAIAEALKVDLDDLT